MCSIRLCATTPLQLAEPHPCRRRCRSSCWEAASNPTPGFLRNQKSSYNCAHWAFHRRVPCSSPPCILSLHGHCDPGPQCWTSVTLHNHSGARLPLPPYMWAGACGMGTCAHACACMQRPEDTIRYLSSGPPTFPFLHFLSPSFSLPFLSLPSSFLPVIPLFFKTRSLTGLELTK